MLARETVKRRLESDGISYTGVQLPAPAVQRLRWVKIANGATLQIVVSDQWGNIIGGVDLARRLDGTSLPRLDRPTRPRPTVEVR